MGENSCRSDCPSLRNKCCTLSSPLLSSVCLSSSSSSSSSRVLSLLTSLFTTCQFILPFLTLPSFLSSALTSPSSPLDVFSFVPPLSVLHLIFPPLLSSPSLYLILFFFSSFPSYRLPSSLLSSPPASLVSLHFSQLNFLLLSSLLLSSLLSFSFTVTLSDSFTYPYNFFPPFLSCSLLSLHLFIPSFLLLSPSCSLLTPPFLPFYHLFSSFSLSISSCLHLPISSNLYCSLHLLSMPLLLQPFPPPFFFCLLFAPPFTSVCSSLLLLSDCCPLPFPLSSTYPPFLPPPFACISSSLVLSPHMSPPFILLLSSLLSFYYLSLYLPLPPHNSSCISPPFSSFPRLSSALFTPPPTFSSPLSPHVTPLLTPSVLYFPSSFSHLSPPPPLPPPLPPPMHQANSCFYRY